MKLITLERVLQEMRLHQVQRCKQQGSDSSRQLLGVRVVRSWYLVSLSLA